MILVIGIGSSPTHILQERTHFIKTHTKFTIFYTSGGIVPPRDLSISNVFYKMQLKVILWAQQEIYENSKTTIKRAN